jgi:hypothetical protein
MLALTRALSRAIRTGDDAAIARAYLRLAAAIGGTAARRLGQRLLRHQRRPAGAAPR